MTLFAIGAALFGTVAVGAVAYDMRCQLPRDLTGWAIDIGVLTGGVCAIITGIGTLG